MTRRKHSSFVDITTELDCIQSLTRAAQCAFSLNLSRAEFLEIADRVYHGTITQVAEGKPHEYR